MISNETYWGCEIIAHRGGAGFNVQNTAAAFAQSNGWADAFECDVQVSADSTLWVFHDTTVDALTNGTGTFTALSDAYIDTLDVAGEPFLRFADFLIYAKSVGKTVYPEIKGNGAQTRSAIVAAIIAADMGEDCVLQSFDMADVLWVLGNTSFRCGFLTESSDLVSLQEGIDTLGLYSGRGWLLPSYASIIANPSVIEYAAASNVCVSVWTVTMQDQLNEIRAIGVESAMVDGAFEGAER